MQLYFWDSGPQTGIANMAWDEALLEWLRHESEPTWVIRTYQWQPATWSVGCHQSDASVAKACQNKVQAIVKRPTGGRAIDHNGDQSFALITNDPTVWRLTLAQRYPTLMAPIEQALRSCQFTPHASGESDPSAYTRSNQCFETSTPWDVKDAEGTKRLGCAQLVRNGGVLHHGALFWPPKMTVTSDQWLSALVLATHHTLHTAGHTISPQSLPLTNAALQKQYQTAIQKITTESRRLETLMGS
jgi:lipoate-protein ligase A